MKIAVLSNRFSENKFGEVEKDLTTTGNLVVNALKTEGHDAKFFDVNEKTFEKLRNSDIDIAFNVCERFQGNSQFEPHVAAMLELLRIPYTGSGPLALSLCMNKIRVKEILMHHNIPTPRHQVFYSRNKKLDSNLKFPLIVKPSCNDNSIGITEKSVVHNEKDLRNRIGYVLRVYNQPALVEEYIKGREFAIGVLGNGNDSVALPVSEILFVNKDYNDFGILSYDAKWDLSSEQYKGSVEVCPAEVPKYLEQKMKKIALDVFRILEVRDYGRIDVRLDEQGVPYVLEMNPNPGISADNTLPKAAKSLDISYEDMIHEILIKALNRYNIKHNITPKLDKNLMKIFPVKKAVDTFN